MKALIRIELFISLRWKTLVNDDEIKSCLVKSQAFKDATNAFAVRNLLLHMQREKQMKLKDPPSNEQMRFGFYKSSLLFIGLHKFI